MRGSVLVATTAFAFLVETPSLASDWVELPAGAGSNIKTYLDKGSVLVSGHTRQFKVRYDLSGVEASLAKEMNTQYLIDCGRKTISNLSSVRTDSAGKVVESRGQSSLHEPVAPDTISEKLMHIVCGQ